MLRLSLLDIGQPLCISNIAVSFIDDLEWVGL